jgi:hypothetical protein
MMKKNLVALFLFVVVILAAAKHDGEATKEWKRRDLQTTAKCGALDACYLVNIATKTEVRLLPSPSSNVYNAVAQKFSIRCDTVGPINYVSYKFATVDRIEYRAPWYMSGDDAGRVSARFVWSSLLLWRCRPQKQLSSLALVVLAGAVAKNDPSFLTHTSLCLFPIDDDSPRPYRTCRTGRVKARRPLLSRVSFGRVPKRLALPST